MAIPKIVGAQRDFSAGELDEDIKRADENPIMRAGARQMLNVRILNSKALANRPGRTALFLENGRVEEVLMSPGNKFFLAFGAGYLRVYNAAGQNVFNTTKKGDGTTNIPWTALTAGGIVYTVAAGSQLAIYITYADGAPNNVPQVLTWDGVSQSSTWTLSTYAETVTTGGQKRTPFFRLAAPGITLLPSAPSGNINLTFSAAVLAAGMVGTRIRFCDRQILITGVSTATAGTGTVEELLPPSQAITFGAATGVFAVGDELIGATSGAVGIVTAASGQVLLFNAASYTGTRPSPGDTVTGGTSGASATVSVVNGTTPQFALILNTVTGGPFQPGETVTDTTNSSHGPNVQVGTANVTVQLLPQANGNVAQFVATGSIEAVAGPNGTGESLATSVGAPQAVAVWDQEVMNAYRGYPQSVFYDQNRLGFCNFPALGSAIAWSAINLPNDLYVQASTPSNAIFELAPGKSQALFVLAGMESSEFVFCDNAIYYIPISPTVPLQPGSVQFIALATFGILPTVQPRASEQTIVFIKAGGADVGALQAPGAYYRPYVIDTISELHSHLFLGNLPVALSIPSASTQFDEKYLYVLRTDGSIVVGKYAMRQGLIEPGVDGKPKVGWLPWSGAGTTYWMSAFGADVIMTNTYGIPGASAFTMVEKLDTSKFLDVSLVPSAHPAGVATDPLSAPNGKGPLWFMAGGTVFLIDLVTRFMGLYQIDANGFIIPQNQAGENLNSAQLVVGQPWEVVIEPFTPIAGPGNDLGQRMKKRRASRMIVYVSNSTGFVMARLFSGPITPTSPSLGAALNTRRIPAWNVGDNAALAAPGREGAYSWRPLGRAYDPRYAVIKDTPGPLIVHEIGFEASV